MAEREPEWLMGALAAEDAYRGVPDAWQPPDPWARGVRQAEVINARPRPQFEPPPGQAGNLAEVGGRMGDILGSATESFRVPKQYAQPNPYPEGSEEAQHLENVRSDRAAQFGAEWALNTLGIGRLGGGVKGGLGVGGGKITQREVPPTKGEQVANVAETAIEAPAITKAQQRKLESYPYFGYTAQRDYKPGIYKDPRLIAAEAAARTAAEHPALKSLFGVTRDDLWEIGKRGTRQGNVDPETVIWRPDKERGSYAADAIMNPRNAQRQIDALVEAEKYPQLTHGMDAWYVMDPLFERMVKLVGKEQAIKDYPRFNATVTPFSSNSDVLTELNRGTAANMMARQGRFSEFAEFGGMPVASRGSDFPDILRDVKPHLRHGQHIPPVQRYLETGAHGYSQDTVKNPLYSLASGVPETGFQTRLPVPDAHLARASGISDVRKNASPGDYMGGSEYRSFGPWYRENVARPVGIEAVPAQGRQWGLYGPQTGVKTAVGAPKLELLSQLIWERAHRLGIDPAKLRDDVLTGKGHATWLLPAITAGGFAKHKMGDLADQSEYQ